MSIDKQGALHVPVVKSPLPCEECGKPGPNLSYSLVGMTGVLCRECLNAVVTQINQALKETGDKADEKPYTCHECGVTLAFPQAFFYEGLTFCSEHLPAYSREGEGW